MSEKQAKRQRQAMRAMGIDPNPTPRYNKTDLPDTREQRRTKQFRKKAHELELRESNFRQRQAFLNKWNRAFYALFNNRQIKAINRELEAAEAEEVLAEATA